MMMQLVFGVKNYTPINSFIHSFTTQQLGWQQLAVEKELPSCLTQKKHPKIMFTQTILKSLSLDTNQPPKKRGGWGGGDGVHI
jgi:hypothetical protein